MTKDSIFAYYSCTKAITTTAILQLWEKGLIDFDTCVKTYLPKIENIGIIKELKDDGTTLVTKKANVDVTMRMLLTHIAGSSYAFFNDDYNKLLKLSGQPNILKVDETTMDHTFLTLPGTKWHYGMNLDWAGFVLEAITGKKLNILMRIFLSLQKWHHAKIL